MKKSALVIIVFCFLIQCKNETNKSQRFSANVVQKLSDTLIITNVKRDFQTLERLMKKGNIAEIKNYIDDSVERQLTEEFGTEYTENKDYFLQQSLVILKREEDSMQAKPVNKIKKIKIQLNDKSDVIASILANTSYVNDDNEEVINKDFVTLAISEDYGNNFKFLNVYDNEMTRKTLSYKFSEEQINSMKPFQKKK